MINKRHIQALLAIIAVLALGACGLAGPAGQNQPDPPGGSTPMAAPSHNRPSPQATVQPIGTRAHEVAIGGREYTFEALEKAPAGLITFSFKNQGAAVHHVQVVRLHDGVTFEQLMAA